MKRKAILFTLLLVLLAVHGVQAMSSPNFSLPWFTPADSGGGGPASSSNYSANVTIGQAGIGASSSANYSAGIGYWYGFGQQYRVRLPLIVK